jgi:hypothetical protein
MPLVFRAGLDEELHLHLFELAIAENKIPHDDFVAKRFPDLRDTERDLFSHRLLDIIEIDKDALCCLRTKIRNRRVVLDRTDARFEQHIELARLGHRAALPAVRAGIAFELIRAKTMMAILALDQRIGKRVHVTAGLPDAWIHDYRCIYADNIVAVLHHSFPPGALDIVFQFDTERSIIPKTADSAIDLRRLKNESAPLA